MKKYKLIKHWPVMPKIEIGTVINNTSLFFSSLPQYWQEVTEPIKSYTLTKHWPLAPAMVIGTVMKYNAKTGKYYSEKTSGPFGMFSSYVLEENQIKNNLEYWSEHLLEESKTPFERYRKNVCRLSAYLIRRKLNRRIKYNPTSTNIKQWKDDLLWIQKWIDEHPEDSLESGCLYPNSDTKTIVVSFPVGTGKGFSEKPPLGIIPKDIHNHNRLNDISKAINRYLEAKKDIPSEWLIEKRELENNNAK